MLIERDVLAVALTDERLLQQQFEAETVEHARLRVNVQMKPTYIVRLNAHVVTLLRADTQAHRLAVWVELVRGCVCMERWCGRRVLVPFP
jgi:hypothetical protein